MTVFTRPARQNATVGHKAGIPANGGCGEKGDEQTFRKGPGEGSF